MVIDWVEFVKAAILILVGATVTYVRTNPKIMGEIAEAETWLEKIRAAAVAYIDRAEKEFKGHGRGDEKRKWVVKMLYDLIPDKVKPFISLDVVEDVVQSVFDVVNDYAKQQLDKLVDEVVPDEGA